MNLEQIKNEVCIKHGFVNYTEFLYTCKDIKQLDDIINELNYLAQKECLKRASENAEVIFDHKNTVDYGYLEESITNDNNIIK